MGEGNAQLYPDDQNTPSVRVQERHMPLPINHQRGKVFIRSVRFCGKRALLASKPKEVIQQSPVPVCLSSQEKQTKYSGFAKVNKEIDNK